MKRKIIAILTNPFFLALVISSVIIYFLPSVFNKYKAELLEKNKTSENPKFCYHDFDKDGFSDRILFDYKSYGGLSTEIFTKGKVIDQWNFRTYYTMHMFGDYDNNGFDEIYIFTYKNDSIFLSCVEPLNKGIIFKHKFISKYNIINNKIDFHIIKVGVRDLNNDKFKEIVFIINSSFALQPRNIFAYDIINDTVYKSPKSGSGIGIPILYDINNDGVDEIINAENHATGNFNKPFPYSDQHCWLMVINRQLKFMFEPVKIGQYPSLIQVVPYKPGNKIYLAVFYKYDGTLDIPCSLMLFNNKGELLKKRELKSYEHLSMAYLISINKKTRSQLFLIYDNGLIEQYDSNLNTVNTIYIKGIINGSPYIIEDDIDDDGKNEFLFWGKDGQKLIITRNDFSCPIEINVPNNMVYYGYSIILKGNNKPELFLQFRDCSYLFQYYKNSLYYFKYIIYIGIYAIVLLFIMILNKIQKHRIEQKIEAEKQLIELQLKSIKSQLDPHFTLNLISSIGDLFDKKDSKTASYVFGKYSTILRQLIINSDQFTVSLSDELEFVENYLTLEKFRFDKKFDFEIVANNIDETIKVPKMLIHSFVENAIKHGIKYLEKEGKIDVIVKLHNSICYVIIKDNGIGRKKSKQMTKFSTGKGLSIIDQIVESYNKLKKTNISYIIKDLKEGIGTQVIISIPY